MQPAGRKNHVPRPRSLPTAGRGERAAAVTSNSILAALLAREYKHLAPRLEHVTLRRGQILYRAAQKIESVYFPDEAVVAMVDRLDDGRTIEVGIIGREGLVGINIFLGGVATPDKAIVLRAGGAMRMKASELRRELRFGSALQRLLLDYARTFLAVISQSVACSQHHTVEQRLARCLLTMHDYAGSREFLLVQDSIAALLGVRRAGISNAARQFQAQELIRYRRGNVTVLDVPGLRKKSCECYRFIRHQYELLRGALPRLLSG
jgi:CRP-like cAMP-binding protein